MNCLFCKKYLKNRHNYVVFSSYQQTITSLEEYPQTILQYGCVNCNASFDITESNVITFYKFKYKNYEFNFYVSNNHFELHERDNTIVFKILLYLHYLPDITPLNVEQKLKTILTFR